MDGAVYEWDTATGKRIGESVLKSCSYTSVDITPDGKTTFAVGSDKSLKEVADSQVSALSTVIQTFIHCNFRF
jgi:WD40 repeat protein